MTTRQCIEIDKATLKHPWDLNFSYEIIRGIFCTSFRNCIPSNNSDRDIFRVPVFKQENVPCRNSNILFRQTTINPAELEGLHGKHITQVLAHSYFTITTLKNRNIEFIVFFLSGREDLLLPWRALTRLAEHGADQVRWCLNFLYQSYDDAKI